MPRSAGHLIVATLETAGIERVYAVPGESYLDVLDGLYDSPIETIVCRQEGGAGFMGLAEARLTGRPGIAMVTRGPGAATRRRSSSSSVSSRPRTGRANPSRSSACPSGSPRPRNA